MAINKEQKYVNAELENLLKTLDENAEILASTLKQINKSANTTINEFNKFFKGSKEEVDHMLASDDALRQLHDDLVSQMALLNTKIQNNVSLLESLSKKYHITTNEAQNQINSLLEIKKLNQDINDLTKKIAKTTSIDNMHRLSAAKADLMSKLDEAKQKMQSSNVGSLMLSEYESQNKSLRKTVKTFEEIDDISQSITDKSKQFQVNLANSQHEAEKLKKTASEVGKAIDLGYQYISRTASKAWEKYKEINQGVYTMGREMGLATSQISAMQSSAFSKYGEIANKIGMHWQDIAKFQSSYTSATSKSIVLASDTIERLGVLSKYTSQDSIIQMASGMDKFAMSTDDAIDAFAVNMARAANQGLNLKSNAEQFAKNIQLASSYTFRNGVDGISRMTLLSQRLRVNFESITGVIDKFSDIEGAITTSAAIQVLGGQYAASFSNPILMMGKAQTDAEGFTQDLINAVSASAYFNKSKGMVDMSPLEKAKLKAFANASGMSYQELWNMASQRAKEAEISKYVRHKRFNEDQMAFLSNKAQFDKNDKTWYVTNANGVKVDLQNLNQTTLTEIQQQNDVEKSIQSDVRNIRVILNTYIERLAKDDKTLQESLIGITEQAKIAMANGIDTTATSAIKRGMDVTHGMSDIGTIGLLTSGTLFGLVGEYVLGKVGKRLKKKASLKSARKILQYSKATPSNTNTSVLSRRVSVPSSGQVSAPAARPNIMRRVTSAIGKTTSVGGKILKVGGSYVGAALAAYDLYDAYKSYTKDADTVHKSNLSYSERQKQLDQIKSDRNHAMTDAVLGGSFLGAITRGASYGAMFGGPIGSFIGAAGLASVYGLRKLFSKNKSTTAPEQSSEITTNQTLSNQFEYLLSLIQTDVSKIKDSLKPSVTSKIMDYKYVSNNAYFSSSIMPPTNIRPIKLQYSNPTAFGLDIHNPSGTVSKTLKIEPTKIDLNMNGQIRLVGDNKSVKLDIKDILENTSFKNDLVRMLSEELNKKGSLLGILNKESAVTRYNSVANPIARS